MKWCDGQTNNYYKFNLLKSPEVILFYKKFLNPICSDKTVLDINTKWGTHFEPTPKDIEFKIKKLKSELKELEEWKNI